MAVKNKEFIYTLYPILCIKIKVFNLFKCDFVVYIYHITDTDSIAIGNYYL